MFRDESYESFEGRPTDATLDRTNTSHIILTHWTGYLPPNRRHASFGAYRLSVYRAPDFLRHEVVAMSSHLF
ncbi:hypothetical protein HUU05_28055 [candidate division KSB1 bacterium]|nr:hypothetical protein [candidate division KSB1 bacterium]